MECLNAEGETSEAQDIDRLLHAKALGSPPVLKIALDSLDAFEFGQLVAGQTLHSSKNPFLVDAFAVMRQLVQETDLPTLGQFLYRLKNQAIIIRLDVSEAKDAFKLFETINNRGLSLSPTDIIKNFVLGNAARFGTSELALARNRWAELIQHLDGTNTEAFFRHYLIARLNRRITSSFVIPQFKSLFMHGVIEAAQLPEMHWFGDSEQASSDDEADETSENGDVNVITDSNLESNRVTFVDFLDQLVQGAKIYGGIVLAKTGIPKIDRRLRNLKMIKAHQTYGFLMALRVGGCSDKDFDKVLKLTESFLVRRHICRERANDNETAFARLCGVNPLDPIPEVIATYRQYSPSDERFRRDFESALFPPNLIDRARYCLEQFEISEHGNYSELQVSGSDQVHVEHIIPIKIKTVKAKEEFGDWPNYLGGNAEALHPKYVSRIGNLTLFAGELNISASNNPYHSKCVAYEQSGIQLTKSLPEKYPEFRFAEVDQRSAKFAESAVEIWPIP